MRRKLSLLFAVPVLAVFWAFLLPGNRTDDELLKSWAAGMTLVARGDPNVGQGDRYTGPGNPDDLARKIAATLKGRPGWIEPQLKLGSSFVYSNYFEPFAAHPWWMRILRMGGREEGIGLQVMAGRAGAKPTGGPWVTLYIIRSSFGRTYLPIKMSEPIIGWGVQQ